MEKMRERDERFRRRIEAIRFEAQFAEEIRHAGLFDDSFYAPQTQTADRPFIHYLTEGWKSFLAPHPRIQSSDISARWSYYGWVEQISPLEGFWRCGRFFGLDFTGDSFRELQAAELSPIELTPSSNTAIVVHAFYMDEFKAILAALPDRNYDLIVTTPHDPRGVEAIIAFSGRSGRVLYVPNRGRDIFPFIHLLNCGLATAYKEICKLHTKRSLHRPDAKEWFENCLTGLLSAERYDYATNRLGADGVGIVSPPSLLARTENISASVKHLRWLAAKSGFVFKEEDVIFPAGSMFWATGKALEPITSLGLSLRDFEGECAQLDGTLAHALERFIGLAAIRSGFRAVD